ncbi:hypothetical protein [Paremcibacter congregatus]|uniref:hypothetical protein n=1 Tax=Paremcibacter congregatus TaxID=2043170 RepID=UPI0030EDB1BB|tara:strand:+ start:188 stop:526 length:339 start_codon:yes stop_codon:yes gene_type:complete
MKIRLFSLVIFSFLFAQVSCAMSEGYEIMLEAAEHTAMKQISHDDLENHDEKSEHEAEMPDIAHCAHAHPPITFIYANTTALSPALVDNNIFASNINLTGIYHRPPVSPPRV